MNLIKNTLYLYYDKNKKCTVFLTRFNQSCEVSKKPPAILKQACTHYGGSYDGAKEAFSALTGAYQKVPVCVSVMFRIIYIPMLSERSDDCLWVQYNQIKKVKAIGNKCQIEFKNGRQECFECSSRVLKRQMERCASFLDQTLEPATVFGDLVRD